MRTHDGRARFARPRAIGVVAAACLVAACSAPATPPAPVATPVPSRYVIATPYPHMTEPATADAVYLALLADGLVVAPLGASTGDPGRDPVKKINATYKGWPLAIIQYRSAKTLKAANKWKPGVKPGAGEAPIEYYGENILVRWGPIATTVQKRPDPRQLVAAQELRDALDRLLSPLTARTIVRVPVTPPSPNPSADTSGSPAASAKASAAP